ncbi:MAG TPA: PilT/PilU family type 4a pilus ATPase [Vicinamibacteria bacterium]|nr:PilT/PilU family type 4a pilus ATPase [Vicinamibacteria bacterium]
METMTEEQVRLETVAPALKACPLFQALKEEHFPQILKIAEPVRFAADEEIVAAGSPADAFFVVLDGEAAIRIPNPAGESVEIGRIPKGATFGEMGLLLGRNRTASVTALTDLKALKFSDKAFDTMFQKIPKFGLGLSQGLAHRLDEVSAQIPLPKYDRRRGAPSTDVLKLIPKEFCQRHRVLPLHIDGNVLTVGVVDDPSTAIVSAIRKHVPSMELNTVRTDLPFFNEVMQTHSGVHTIARCADAAEPARGRSPELDALLSQMVAEGASDLHLSAGHRPRWRINGDMQEVADAPILAPSQVFELLKPVMAERHRTEFTEDNDSDFAYAVPGLARFRVNLFRDHHGTGAVFRQIPSTILSLDQLGHPAVLKDLCDIPKGLVLVTGPTGCGKSTTLAAMIDHINKSRKLHIVTLEDPIEFVHESSQCLVNQREVGGHTKSFGRGLRSALREDPDVVLVGEMRDLETISLALETANTGHLVFATLHTNSAVSTVDRIVDQFPAHEQAQVRSVLADVLRAVVTQTLVKKKEGGRIAALEILVVNYAIANLIREAKTVQIPSIIQTNKAMGMQLLNDVLAELVETRKIELKEAMAHAVDKKDLEKRFRNGLSISTDPAGGDRFRVVDVKPNSPAFFAGLKRGTLIFEIDGRPATAYSLDEARRALRADGTHPLSISDGSNKKVKINLELPSL